MFPGIVVVATRCPILMKKALSVNMSLEEGHVWRTPKPYSLLQISRTYLFRNVKNVRSSCEGAGFTQFFRSYSTG